MNCFFFIEFFLYLQYFLIRCTNSFYQVLTNVKIIKNKLIKQLKCYANIQSWMIEYVFV